MDNQFDFIVVGAGTAGCVLAARLTESGKHRVLLLEAGGEASSPWIRIPFGYSRLIASPRYNWRFVTAPEPELHDRRIDQPCGRVIGGTGSINGMLYIRGQPRDYDRWLAAGNNGWGWNDVLPWFRHSERNVRGEDAWHGANGPLAVADRPQRHPLADAFIAAAVEAGFERNDDFNGARQEGAGYYQSNALNGWRASTATAYLAPARRRANLVVATNALVTRLVCVQGRAVAVEYTQDGQVKRAEARREIAVAAGTFKSPQLLQLSGIGPGELLRHAGIDVVHDLPGVGENLQNHFRANVVMRCLAPITHNDFMRSPLRRVAAGLRYIFLRDGPLASGTSTGGFFRSQPHVDAPDLQVTFWTYSVAQRDAQGVVLHPFPGFTANAVILRPQSRGTVHIENADPRAMPTIRYNHLAEESDRTTLVDGLKVVRSILRQPALSAYAGEELTPGTATADDAALLEYARRTGGSVYHPVGTCRMGSDRLAVVDERLRVHGVRGLRVADASIMPTIVSGNTNAPTIMIAERAADWMLADAAQ